MEIKLDSKLMNAVSGLMLFAISIIVMAIKDINLTWLIGLFLMFAACAKGYAAYLENKDQKLAAIACIYFLFAIVFFAKNEAFNSFLFIVWAMAEGAILSLDGMKNKEANLWFVGPCLAAVAILLAYVNCFVYNQILAGLPLLLVALAQVFPMCAGCMPKCELKLKK